jgi:hypothetical protein
MVMRVPRELAEAEVWTPDGSRVAIAETWRERTAILAFVRHFG